MSRMAVGFASTATEANRASPIQVLSLYIFKGKVIVSRGSSLWWLRPCLVRTFSSLSFHYSVFITHHSSLKISQFSLPCVWTLFSLQITQIFHHFLWEPQLITKSVATVVYSCWFPIPLVLISPSPLKTECLSQNPNPNPLFLRWSSLASPR